MTTVIKLDCPYCQFEHKSKESLSILDFGTIKKLQECKQCGGYFMYELELDIKTKIKSIAGEGSQGIPEDAPEIRPAPVKLKAAPEIHPAPVKLEPAPVKLKAVKGKLGKRPGPKSSKPIDGSPVDVEAVFLWIKTNNSAYKYERGFINSDIYRYCRLARTAARTKEALDALEALGKIVKLPEPIKSCRGNESGSFGYRLAWEGQKKKKLNFKQNATNYIKSTP